MQVALGELGDLAQPLAPCFGGDAWRAGGADQDLAQGLVLALGAQVVAHPGQRVRVGRIPRQHFLEFLERVDPTSPSDEGLRFVECHLQRVGARSLGRSVFNELERLRQVRLFGLGRLLWLFRYGWLARQERLVLGRNARHRLAEARMELAQLRRGLGIPDRQRLQNQSRVFELLGGLIAGGEQPPRIARHGAVGIGLDVGEVPRSHLLLALNRVRVVGVELERPIVPGVDVEGARRVSESVLAVVQFGQTDQQFGSRGPLMRSDVFAPGETFDDEPAVLLLQRWIAVVELPRQREGLGRVSEIAGGPVQGRSVPQKSELTLGIAFERKLCLRHAKGVVPLAERFVNFPSAAERCSARWHELRGPAKVLERLLGLMQAFVPKSTQLLVHHAELVAYLAALRSERRQCFRAPFEQRDQRLHLAFVAVELRQPIGGDPLGGIAVDGLHQHTRCPVGVSERDGPHIRSFAQPVGGVRGIPRFDAYALKKESVRLGIRGAGVVRLGQSLFVVRVGDKPLNEIVDLARIHRDGG